LLDAGAHTLAFEAVDEFGQKASKTFSFEVTAPPKP